MQDFDFVAIDFETANQKRGSICQAAIAVVKNGQIVYAKDWYIKPKNLYFAPMNIYIHGITADKVADAPEFPEVWEEMKEYIEGGAVLAHNASFDIYALRDVLKEYDIELPGFRFLCTLRMSREWFELKSYRLSSVCKHLEIDLTDYHNAKYDAIACAMVAIRMGIRGSYRYFPEDLIGYHAFDLPPRKMADLSGIEVYDLSSGITPETLKNKGVCVTGIFNEMSRKQAEAYVLKLGARLTSSINKSTALVVMGGAAGPSKIEKLKELNETMFIPLIDEAEYVEVLQALGIYEQS